MSRLMSNPECVMLLTEDEFDMVTRILRADIDPADYQAEIDLLVVEDPKTKDQRYFEDLE